MTGKDILNAPLNLEKNNPNALDALDLLCQTMTWKRIGTTGNYIVWKRDCHGKAIYNVTPKNQVPSPALGGYYNLESLLKIKSLDKFVPDAIMTEDSPYRKTTERR